MINHSFSYTLYVRSVGLNPNMPAHSHTHLHAHAHTLAHTHLYACLHTYAHIHTHSHTHMPVICMHAQTFFCMPKAPAWAKPSRSQAANKGSGLAQWLTGPELSWARPKPRLLGQAGPAHHYCWWCRLVQWAPKLLRSNGFWAHIACDAWGHGNGA